MCLTSWARVSCRISLEADCQIKFLQICSVPLQNVRSTLRLAETRPSVTFSTDRNLQVKLYPFHLQWFTSATMDDASLCVCTCFIKHIVKSRVCPVWRKSCHPRRTKAERLARVWFLERRRSIVACVTFAGSWSEVPAPFSYEALQRTFKFWLQVVVWFLLDY